MTSVTVTFADTYRGSCEWYPFTGSGMFVGDASPLHQPIREFKLFAGKFIKYFCFQQRIVTNDNVEIQRNWCVMGKYWKKFCNHAKLYINVNVVKVVLHNKPCGCLTQNKIAR